MKSAFDLWALKTKRSPLIKRLRNAKIERMKSYEELRVKRKELAEHHQLWLSILNSQ